MITKNAFDSMPPADVWANMAFYTGVPAGIALWLFTEQRDDLAKIFAGFLHKRGTVYSIRVFRFIIHTAVPKTRMKKSIIPHSERVGMATGS